MSGPLEGLRVVELSTWAFGPLAGVILGDLGAQVIKVEHPEGGDPARHLKWVSGVVDAELPHGRNALFEIMNRGKQSLTLDLKDEEAREILRGLASETDVFLQNFRTGVAERLGIGYESLKARNPRLIYASANGYGARGPEAGRPALDYVGQARSGLMWAGGRPGDPPNWNTLGLADIGGAIILAFGITSAVAARERTGIGQHVSLSHLGASMLLEYWAIGMGLLTGVRDWPRFDRTATGNPLWNHYQCADERWIALGFLQPDRYWDAFCLALGREDLVADPRFADTEARRANSAELTKLLDEVFAGRPRREWEELLGKNPDFVFERVQTLDELPSDPQVIANQYISSMEHADLGSVGVVNFPVHLSETPAQARSATAPRLGEHTESLLRERLKLTAADIEVLRARGAI